MDKMTPQKVVETLAKHGNHITIEEAVKIQEFLAFLADIEIEQFLERYQQSVVLGT